MCSCNREESCASWARCALLVTAPRIRYLTLLHVTGSRYLTIIRAISVVGRWALSGTVSISKKTVRTIRSKLDQCVAPNLTMCLLYLSVYGCCKLTELYDFLVVFYKLRIIGNSADGSAICCIIGGRHRAVLTEGRNRAQLADNCRADHPDFTVGNNIIRYVYRAELILGR